MTVPPVVRRLMSRPNQRHIINRLRPRFRPVLAPKYLRQVPGHPVHLDNIFQTHMLKDPRKSSKTLSGRIIEAEIPKFICSITDSDNTFIHQNSMDMFIESSKRDLSTPVYEKVNSYLADLFEFYDLFIFRSWVGCPDFPQYEGMTNSRTKTPPSLCRSKNCRLLFEILN